MNSNEERWQELFTDLQQNFLGQERIDRSYLVSDLRAAELASLELTRRLTASLESEVNVRVITGRQYSGVLAEVQNHWIEINQMGGALGRRIIPFEAIDYLSVLEAANVKVASQKTRGIKETLASRIRSIAFERKTVAIETRSGEAEGIVINVAKDYFELILKAKNGQAGKHHKMLVPLTKLVTLRICL